MMNKVSIKKTSERGFDLGVKRFYAPFEITQYCPDCEEDQKFDLMDYPLYDPILNVSEEMSFTCQSCGEELDPITLKISVNIELVEDE